MKNARTLLAIASAVIASFALTPSARAEEPAPAPDPSEAPAAEAPTSDAPTSDAPPTEPLKVASPPTSAPRVDLVAPPPLAPTRASSVTTSPVRVAEQGPRSPGLGIAGIVTTVLGGGAVATGIGLVSAQEDAAMPTVFAGSLVAITGIVMTAAGYSSPSTEANRAEARRSRRVAPTVPEPTWEEKQASRARRRNVGIGLTVGGVAVGALSAALIATTEGSIGPNINLGGSGGGGGNDDSARVLVAVLTVPPAAALLGVGIPLWAANSGEEPRPLVRTELGIGPGSIELRGSF